ncbi:hypothetical protein J2S74_005280 [Evansella vedderi]|uniref:Uncharacterized protein n=1 Tax=Evansella vedderi TaxID=38282 RepID=A0ABU0A2V2_9BACI|nr:hypothetical protein [Evansella vedderi]MDQ0257818.1 hypothetical protein [Evansella vedderi]
MLIEAEEHNLDIFRVDIHTNTICTMDYENGYQSCLANPLQADAFRGQCFSLLGALACSCGVFSYCFSRPLKKIKSDLFQWPLAFPAGVAAFHFFESANGNMDFVFLG